MKLLNLKCTPVFHKNYNANTRIVVNQGGTRSSKSYSITQLFIVKALQETNKTFTFCRKTLPALKGSTYKDFFEILNNNNIYNPEHHNKSELTYYLNSNTIEFISVDQPQKIRGRKRNYLNMCEANEFNVDDFRQLALRTTEQIFLDYNPSDEYHFIYDEILTRNDCTFIKSTYKDNPFLSKETIQEIERLKEIDKNYWRVFGLGLRGTSQQTIFINFELIDEIPSNAKLIGVGMDFGFTADATAIIEVYKHDTNTYFNELIYARGLTNQDISDELHKFSVQRNTIIVADSSEPKSIEEIHRQNWNIKPSKKGADSIKNGIDIMKRHKIHITKNSINLIKEFRNYKWQTDKNNKIINKPVDAFNHGIDAVRYIHLNLLAINFTGKYYIH